MEKCVEKKWKIRWFNVVGDMLEIDELGLKENVLACLEDERKSAFMVAVNLNNKIEEVEYVRFVESDDKNKVSIEIIKGEEAFNLYRSCYNEEQLFVKLIIPLEEEFKECKIKPPNYLINHLGGNNFLLLRELSSEEVESMKEENSYDEAFANYDVIKYKEKDYIWLTNFPTEEDAMLAIKSYWRAIKELNQLDDSDHNEKNYVEENAKYIEDSKDKNKKIAYSYSFNWFDFTYNGKKSDYCFDATIKFNTFEFEEDCIGGVTNYLSARIDLQEEKLITQIDPNVLFNVVEVIDFFIDDTNSGFYKKLNVEEGKLLIKEYCRQAKENKLSHIELTGSPLAFRYVE
ncbi:hypothetical protein P5G86_24285 [Paenibacillus jamilae]|uniref:hypothetical protein n=1 Tax=unclassified Bacillus cereus group TaxID=2750818 RepID=UPI001298D34C|nr:MULTISPECIES: hypothetical protein [Bacillus cereus group]MEB4843113.1 hypothetical protein [Paenibacillus jamilae]MEB8830988.1 hypothetical protein [Bacillus cereus]MCR6856577.1 hypothetical protein [Bacillus thuringiensis]MEB9274836.1 hypothetical protein [Bacillus cereus]MEC3037368.1 hypothetical protein [Bacillus cereus]